MRSSGSLSKIILLLCGITILIFIYGHFFDTTAWGMLTAKCVPSPIFYPMMALGIIIATAFVLRKDRDTSSGDGGLHNPVAIGLVGAVIGVLVLWIAGSGGFFWRNLFDGPISIFGSYSEIVRSYSDLPPIPNLVELWEHDTFSRVVTMILGGIYLLILSLVTAETSDDSKARFLMFIFLASSGLLAVFTSANDFALLLVLSSLNVLLILKFIKGKLTVYIPGIVLLISVLFHPVFALVAISLLFVRIAAPFVESRKAGIPLLMLVILVAIGAGLSLLNSVPFISVFLPKTSAYPTFGIDQLWSIVNQLFMASHLIWLLAVVSAIYMFASSRISNLVGMFLGSWLLAASGFYLTSYSVYGWIFGYPGASIVVLPAILWVAYLVSTSEKEQLSRCFVMLIVANVIVTIPLLATLRLDTKSMEVMSDHLEKEYAFNPRFNDGLGSLLLGTMYSESYQKYEEALPVLEAFNRRYPLQIVGKYYYAWTQTNIRGKLIPGLDLLREVQSRLEEEGKLFWEFNHRLGVGFIGGHNAYMASIHLERAASEKTTIEIARLLGSCYENIKAYDSMASKYTQAIELGDTASENFYKVAFAYDRMNDTLRSVEYARKSVALFPQYVDSYEYLARYYFLNQMYDSLEILASYGLESAARSAELEACMMLVYHYTDRHPERDSLYDAFIEYHRIFPEALYNWGVFLEANGLQYHGRKMQAADLTVDQLNLKAILTFYHQYKKVGLADSARTLIDRYAEAETAPAILDILNTVKRYDNELWPTNGDSLIE